MGVYGGLWRDLKGAFCPMSALGAERAEKEKESGVAPSAASPPEENLLWIFVNGLKWRREGEGRRRGETI